MTRELEERVEASGGGGCRGKFGNPVGEVGGGVIGKNAVVLAREDADVLAGAFADVLVCGHLLVGLNGVELVDAVLSSSPWSKVVIL